MRNRFITLVMVSGLVLMSCGGDDSAGDDTTAVPDTTEQAEPETTEPEVSEPETTEPPVTEPETETTEPETTEPETTEPETTEPETTEPETTESETTEPEPGHTIELAACEQVAIYLPIDASTAADRIPGDVELVVEDGRSTSLFLAHECGEVLVDGTSAGPAHINVQWLPIPGPEEVREVPEHEGVPVMPTAYWHPLATETDNPAFQQLAAEVGLEMTLVDTMVFNNPVDLDDPNAMWPGQDGEVSSTEPAIRYVWMVGTWGEVPLVDQPMVLVHVAGNLETEMFARVRVSHDGVLGFLHDADGPAEPIGQEPEEDGGQVFVTTWDLMVFEVAS